MPPKNTKRERRERLRERALAASPRRMGHEAMSRLPAFRDALESLVARLRRPPTAPVQLVSEGELAADPAVDKMLESRYVIDTQLNGHDHEAALGTVQLLCTHLECATNFILAGRKAFWVDGQLVELLRQTRLDISGEALRLPFSSCAFLFDDPITLAAVQAFVDEGGVGSRPCRMLTVYVSPTRVDAGEVGVTMTFLADSFGPPDDWPYLVSRDIPTGDKRNLDEILDSHPDESTDPFFRSTALRELVHQVINAILYTTCREMVFEVRPPPDPRRTIRNGHGAAEHRELTGETVFFLPGRVLIDNAARAAEGSAAKGHTRTIGKRHWVRGHWRRANPDWNDQRLRWIAPHLKGPELTAIIERQYELLPARAPRGGGDITE